MPGDLKMAILLTRSIFFFLLLTYRALALQVTPNSPCAAVCLDDRTKDLSDPTTSNTFSKDIVCKDSSYTNTVVGEKFESCIACLQTSSFSDSGENDQEWFLYNIRYAFDTCVFGFENASDTISTSCSTANSCGHLQKALETGDLDPTESTFGYCSADNNAFLGTFLSKCFDCMEATEDTQYLTNFLTALQAGCLQLPGTLVIGLDGSVFSSDAVNITYPGYNQKSGDSQSHKKGLPKSTIIGLAIGGAILLAIIITILFVCLRKRHDRNNMRRLTSPLDSRFGAKNITSPNNGAYGNPYATPPIHVVKHFDPFALSPEDRQVLGMDQPTFSRQTSSSTKSQISSTNGRQHATSHRDRDRGNQLPPYPGSSVPTHQAYIPEAAAESPVTSIDSSSFQMSTYSSPRSSSKNKVPPPPPIHVPTKERSYTPFQIHSSEVVAKVSGGRFTPSPPYPQIDTRVPQRSFSRSELRRNTATTGAGSQIHPPGAEAKSSGSRSTPSPPYVRVDTRVPPRSISRCESRSASRNGSRRSTATVGIGNANASTVSPSDRDAPLVNYGLRFDFELAERERRENDILEQKSRRKKADLTPESAESNEQWPGTY